MLPIVRIQGLARRTRVSLHGMPPLECVHPNLTMTDHGPESISRCDAFGVGRPSIRPWDSTSPRFSAFVVVYQPVARRRACLVEGIHVMDDTRTEPESAPGILAKPWYWYYVLGLLF